MDLIYSNFVLHVQIVLPLSYDFYPFQAFDVMIMLRYLFAASGSHVAMTLLRKPDQQRLRSTPTSPGAISVGSSHSKNGGGSDRITHPIPVDVRNISISVSYFK